MCNRFQRAQFSTMISHVQQGILKEFKVHFLIIKGILLFRSAIEFELFHNHEDDVEQILFKNESLPLVCYTSLNDSNVEDKICTRDTNIQLSIRKGNANRDEKTTVIFAGSASRSNSGPFSEAQAYWFVARALRWFRPEYNSKNNVSYREWEKRQEQIEEVKNNYFIFFFHFFR